MKILTSLSIISLLFLLVACSKPAEPSTASGDENPHVDDHHVHMPHLGVYAPIKAGDKAAVVELKLHDDKGDLELWITNDKDGKEP